MKWTTIKARVVLARTLVLTVELVEGSAAPWLWRVVALKGDRWPLFGGWCRTEANAKRAALDAGKKEMRIRSGKSQLLNRIEREWDELGGGEAGRRMLDGGATDDTVEDWPDLIEEGP